MEYNYFNEQLEPLTYKQWLRTIRYLKDVDLYNEFIKRTYLYTKQYPNETNGQFGLIPFMNRFMPRQCTYWIGNGMRLDINENRLAYSRFDTLTMECFLRDMEESFNKNKTNNYGV